MQERLVSLSPRTSNLHGPGNNDAIKTVESRVKMMYCETKRAEETICQIFNGIRRSVNFRSIAIKLLNYVESFLDNDDGAKLIDGNRVRISVYFPTLRVSREWKTGRLANNGIPALGIISKTFRLAQIFIEFVRVTDERIGSTVYVRVYVSGNSCKGQAEDDNA